jgi:allantoate deiminase
MERIDALARLTEEPGRITRTFCSPAMREANQLVASWMREAGMTARQDSIGNVIGHYSSAPNGEQSSRKVFLLGSHLDSVRDAGRFDGPLGVVVAIACVEVLRDKKALLPFALEVAGFADEEGVRYHSTYLGSKVLAGTFDPKVLQLKDSNGISMAEAIRNFGGDPDRIPDDRRDPNQLLGYAEVHIEQGPVLEQKDLAVGVVTAISGQSRVKVTFTGRAGHAGTVPMSMRRDALCAAAEFVLAVESTARSREGLVATVGELSPSPGASNVIPGAVSLSLDVRHPTDSARTAACADLRAQAEAIAARRGSSADWQLVHESGAVTCDRALTASLSEAVQRRHQPQPCLLASGAGHDAAALAAITPVAMLFVRCKGGVSHHPDESVRVEDVRVAIEVMTDFLANL